MSVLEVHRSQYVNISLVIPAHNEEKYLPGCLESIAPHVNRFLEVIVVDNASTDATAQIARRFEFARVIHEPRKGLLWARQRGFLESRGDHLAYMDADCRMPQAWADIVQREFSTYPNLVALSGPFVLATYKYILAIPLTGFSDMIYRKIVIDMLGVVGTLAAVVAMWQGFVYAAAVLGAIQSGAMGILGLIVAVVGIYGVVSHGVAQRTLETGIRMALGATPLAVVGKILGRAIHLIAGGIGAGLLAALAVTSMLKGFLAGVSNTDPVTFLLVPVLLALVAMFASYLPARRAALSDPMVVLRCE